MPLKEKLNHLIELKRITPYGLAIDTGISEATFSRILNGSTKSLKNKTLNILADYFGVSREWLKNEEELQPVEEIKGNIILQAKCSRCEELKKEIEELIKELKESQNDRFRLYKKYEGDQSPGHLEPLKRKGVNG